jgi:two-component system, OmpR family, sensor kinase
LPATRRNKAHEVHPSLAVSTILITLAGIGRFDTHDALSERMGNFIGAILPPEGDQLELARTVRRIGVAANADISVYDAAGRLLAYAGPPLPFSTTTEDPKGFGPPPPTFVFTTPQGLRVIAHSRKPFGPRRRNIAFMILLTAGVLGLVAWPVTRHLTRRLKTLTAGMTVWSNGALESRVAVEGDDEIADVAKTFNLAAARIEELVNAQKSLLANASHELRSPLARLRMAIEMFEISPRENLKTEIVGNLRELDDLVEEILLMSRLESRQSEVLDEACDLLAIAAEETAYADASVSGDPVTMLGNQRLLRRMVRNLLQNASRHGKPPIEISVTRTDGEIRLSVRDHGPGLSGNDPQRVFEPFYRPLGHGEAAGGWGLGLALVRQIAELHGGRAWYEPADGGGARFNVAFHIMKQP